MAGTWHYLHSLSCVWHYQRGVTRDGAGRLTAHAIRQQCCCSSIKQLLARAVPVSAQQPTGPSDAYSLWMQFHACLFVSLPPCSVPPPIFHCGRPRTTVLLTSYLMLGLQLAATHLEDPFGYDLSDLELDLVWNGMGREGWLFGLVCVFFICLFCLFCLLCLVDRFSRRLWSRSFHLRFGLTSV